MTRIDGATANRGWLLALDTATSLVVVAAGTSDGQLLAARSFAAEHRHGERLLAAVQELIDASQLDLGTLAGVIVGTGPGAFTGLRVGMATAKTLAHELGLPIAGLSTGEALLEAATSTDPARTPAALLLPAGPHDRVEVRRGVPPRLLAGGTDPEIGPSDVVIAVDLDGRAPAEAIERGSQALRGLPAALLHLGAARLDAGSDDPETLLPEYVTLPRGALAAPGDGGMSWSRDRR